MPRYFISYRRDDVPGHTGRLYDNLVREFGEDRIFMDVSRMSPGEDFVDNLDVALREADAMIVVIGPRWLETIDPVGGQRIHDPVGGQRIRDPADFVRRELAAAFEREVPVIPVLVDGAAMPGSGDLPEAVADLARRQAVEISDTRWTTDFGRLTTALAAAESLHRRPPPARWEAAPIGERSPEWARLDYHGRVHAIACAPDGSLLAAGTEDGAPVWDVGAAQELHRFLPGHSVTAVDFSPDGARLATASGDGSQIWSVATDEERVRAWESETVRFSPDGRWLICTMIDGYDGSATVFDANDGRYLMSFYAGIRDRFTAVAWSPDGRVIATLNTYQQLVLYVAEGLDKPHATSPARPITRGKIPECDAFSFSSDGHWLGYASRGHFPNGLAMIVDVENLEPLKSLEHRHPVSALTFSPDGRLLATISEEMVYLWDFTSGTRETSLPHPNSVISIAFSPDGRSLASQDGSDTVTLWSVSTGEQTGRLRHDDGVQLVSFSPDGATLATATPETIHVWRRLP